MKHFVCLAIAAVATISIVACDNSVKGNLTVDQAFQVQNTDGNVITVTAASYASTLKMKDSKTLDVTFKMDGGKQDIRIKLPKGMSLPTNGNGQFYIKGDDVGTTFDIKGTLTTTVISGPQQHAVTTCYMQQAPPICFPIPNGGVACQPAPPQQGFMDVIYHLETTTVKANAEFTSSVNDGHLASFVGTNTDTSEIYDMQGFCHF